MLFFLYSGLLACSSYLQGFFSCWHMPGGLAPHCLPSHQCSVCLHCNPLGTAVSVGGCLVSMLFDGGEPLKRLHVGSGTCVSYEIPTNAWLCKTEMWFIAKIFLLFWKEQQLVIQKLSLLWLGIAFNYREFIYTAQWEQKGSLRKHRLLLESCEWNDNYSQVRLNWGENYFSLNGKVMCGSREGDGSCQWA